MTNIKITENEAMTFLIDNAKLSGSLAPRAIVINRVVKNPERSFQRIVKIALIVTSDNETLVDFLIEKCLEFDNDIYFVGSDVNFQNDLEIDYLFFETKIMTKKQ